MSRARSSTLILAAAAGAVLISVGRVSGQTVSELHSGSRIRVSAPGLELRKRVGIVTGTSTSGLTVLLDGELTPRHIGYGHVSAMDVSVRREGHPFLGFGLGVLVGGAAGYFTGLAIGDDPPRCSSIPGIGFGLGTVRVCREGGSAGEKARSRAWIFGIVGGLAGVAIGKGMKTDVWERVRTGDDVVDVRPTLSWGQAGVEVTLRTAWR